MKLLEFSVLSIGHPIKNEPFFYSAVNLHARLKNLAQS